jgi:hypothetical protein
MQLKAAAEMALRSPRPYCSRISQRAAREDHCGGRSAAHRETSLREPGRGCFRMEHCSAVGRACRLAPAVASNDFSTGLNNSC